MRNEIIGRRDDNPPYEHDSSVAKIECSDLIGRKFASRKAR